MSVPLAPHVRMEVYAQIVWDLLPVTVMGLASVEQFARVIMTLNPIFITSFCFSTVSCLLNLCKH